MGTGPMPSWHRCNLVRHQILEKARGARRRRGQNPGKVFKLKRTIDCPRHSGYPIPLSPSWSSLFSDWCLCLLPPGLLRSLERRDGAVDDPATMGLDGQMEHGKERWAITQ